MTKPELVAELAVLGLEAPASWTVKELEYHLQELRSQKGIEVVKGKVKTPLQQLVSQMNEASRKKANLASFMTQTLEIPVDGNSTINEMTKSCLDHIYQQCDPHSEDPVGFGQHSSLTYRQIKMEYPSYCKWVVQTHQEGECSPMLHRLAVWLNQGAHVTPSPVKSKNKAVPKTTTPPKTSASSSETETNKMLVTMHQTLMALKEEVEELKENKDSRPPRKTPALAMDTDSASGFELMSSSQ